MHHIAARRCIIKKVVILISKHRKKTVFERSFFYPIRRMASCFGVYLMLSASQYRLRKLESATQIENL